MGSKSQAKAKAKERVIAKGGAQGMTLELCVIFCCFFMPILCYLIKLKFFFVVLIS
uniref:Transmembrane protein n=1 Tax=Medicago truncatula TaxID=3880 RepID=I3SJZ5_MEDTR|nr:unknown [Medicago truncatula]